MYKHKHEFQNDSAKSKSQCYMFLSHVFKKCVHIWNAEKQEILCGQKFNSRFTSILFEMKFQEWFKRNLQQCNFWHGINAALFGKAFNQFQGKWIRAWQQFSIKQIRKLINKNLFLEIIFKAVLNQESFAQKPAEMIISMIIFFGNKLIRHFRIHSLWDKVLNSWNHARNF